MTLRQRLASRFPALVATPAAAPIPAPPRIVPLERMGSYASLWNVFRLRRRD